MILREAFATNHIDFIHQPRPEERAPEHRSKDARVSKDGRKRGRARGHPSSFGSLRTATQEGGLLRMRSEGLISAVRCDWFHGIDRRVASAFRDRKSTRLNSSHQIISYAVFCLKKKKTFLVNSYTACVY